MDLSEIREPLGTGGPEEAEDEIKQLKERAADKTKEAAEARAEGKRKKLYFTDIIKVRRNRIFCYFLMKETV